MRHSVKAGFSFGLTSGVITTLGLLVGLHSGTHSKLAVVGGILTIAFADALSDALGIHISMESRGTHSGKEVWESTFATFISKFLFAISFLPPVLLLSLPTSIVVSIVWGFFLIGTLSYYLAIIQNERAFKVISEHIFIAIVVVLLAHFIGHLISSLLSD